MAGTSKRSNGPEPRALARATRDELGRFERLLPRRPGIGGAVACLVILVVVMNLIHSEVDNFWGRSAEVVGPLIIVIWIYVWFKRVRGGLYLFSEGFVDVAGGRVVSVAWSEITSIEAEVWYFSISLIPIGVSSAYKVAFTERKTGHHNEWTLNTTYYNVHELAKLMSKRSRIPVTGNTNPYY